MKKVLFSVTVLFLSNQIIAQNQLIPKPQEVKINDGFLQLSSDFGIQSLGSKSEADYLKKQLKVSTFFPKAKENLHQNRHPKLWCNS